MPGQKRRRLKQELEFSHRTETAKARKEVLAGKISTQEFWDIWKQNAPDDLLPFDRPITYQERLDSVAVSELMDWRDLDGN